MPYFIRDLRICLFWYLSHHGYQGTTEFRKLSVIQNISSFFVKHFPYILLAFERLHTEGIH